MAGLTSTPSAAAPSEPRLTTVPPASPKVYQSSGVRQLLCDDGAGLGEEDAGAVELCEALAEVDEALGVKGGALGRDGENEGERVVDGEAVPLGERVSDGEGLGEAVLLVLLDGEKVLLALLDGEAECEGVGQAAAMCAAAVEALSGTSTTRPP